jgi:hypothetical protein
MFKGDCRHVHWKISAHVDGGVEQRVSRAAQTREERGPPLARAESLYLCSHTLFVCILRPAQHVSNQPMNYVDIPSFLHNLMCDGW